MVRTSKLRNVLAVALAAGGGLLAVMPATPAGAAPPPGGGTQIACPAPKPGEWTCFAQVRTDGTPSLGVQLDAPPGYGPADLQSAYRLPVTAGAGRTVAIVAAGDAPVLEGDLLTYRAQFGLPECSSLNGCFRKINQRGATSPPPIADVGYAAEATLDVEMVSAACPLCHILVVEVGAAQFAWDGPTGQGTPNGVGGFSNFVIQKPADATIFLGESTSATLTASGGTAPYAFLVSPLPAGLSYNSATRVISGTPTFTGTALIGVRAVDALGVASQEEFTVTVIDHVSVPEVEGLSLSAATNRLHQVGLFQVHGSVVSCEGVPGTVISQTPDEGTVVPVGSTVTLTLARAPAPGHEC
jgi:hypothetical protein